jgi:FKBP-type peptidyl-prolyl cis-trans isomerase
MRPGRELLEDDPGDGAPVRRQGHYDFRVRIWLSRGEAVRWKQSGALADGARIEDDGSTLLASLRVDRKQMFAGLFYGVEGMRVGARRKLRVAPHLAYGPQGVPGIIPPNAVLTVEVTVLAERRTKLPS